MIPVIVFILLVSLGLCLALLFLMLPLRKRQGGLILILADLAMAIWTIGYLLEILLPEVAIKVLWAKVQYIGIAFLPVLFLFFILQYVGRISRIEKFQILAVLTIPCMTLLLAATNEFHLWLWTKIQLQPNGLTLAPLDLTHGWWFWVHAAYSYSLVLIGIILLGLFAFRTQKTFRSQSIVMLVGMLVPWLANATYIFDLHLEPGLDFTPIAFAITNGMLALGFLRFGLLNILPIAHATIFQAMVDGVIILDLKDRIVDANPAARHIFEQVSELNVGDLIRPLLPAWPEHMPAEVLRQEVSFGARPNCRTYSMQISPIKNNRGILSGQMVLLTDITELKLAQSQMYLQATALNSAENGIMITDPKGDIEWVNPAFTRLNGYQFGDVVGQNARILKSGKHPKEFYNGLWAALNQGKVWRGEMINRRKDGSLYYEEMTLTPLLNAQGETEHIIAIKQDITERKDAEEALKLANAEVLKASQLKSQLLANVSHELRTPLSAIVGFAEMLNADVYGEVSLQQSRVLEDILDSSNQLLFFVNNLIDRAQIDVGKIVLHQSRFQITDLVETAKLTVGGIAEKKGLQVDYEVDLNLPHTLYGDLYWLRQIVQNLMANAVKFTDKGSVRFRLEKKSGDTWAIEVKDTGIGIPKDETQSIFEPFHQVDSSPTRSRAGSGLGLSIVKELVSLMRGVVRLETEMGVGSCFTIILPLNRGE